MKNKLKPCPYCVGTQGHIRVYYVGKMCRVYCDSCIAKTGFYATIDEAMDAWNEGKLLKRVNRSVEQKGVYKEMTELKPCPFCGGKAELKVNYVKCTQCYARTGQYDTQEAAETSWNTRAEQTKP